MLFWFGHRAGCASLGVVPRYRGDDALVCEACMPELVPRCPLCGLDAPVVGREDGFRHHAFHYLCLPCRQRVLTAGEARARRAAVTHRRVETLLRAYEGLYIDELAARRVCVRGSVEGRSVWITVRDAARQYECERFVVRVQLRHDAPLDAAAVRGLLRVTPCEGSPKRVTDRGEWLWAGFRHLGNADLLHALDVLLAVARDAEA